VLLAPLDRQLGGPLVAGIFVAFAIVSALVIPHAGRARSVNAKPSDVEDSSLAGCHNGLKTRMNAHGGKQV
jgi:hypothetical protein